MTSKETLIYEMLRFFNEPHVRKGVSLDEVRQQFYHIEKSLFTKAFNLLALTTSIDKTSPGSNWQITEKGETELNRLQTEINLEKNLKATEENIVATTNLVQTGKDNEKGIRWNRRLTLFVSACTLAVTYVQYTASDKATDLMNQQLKLQERQYKHQIQLDSISRIRHLPDTTYVIYLGDTSKNPLNSKGK